MRLTTGRGLLCGAVAACASWSAAPHAASAAPAAAGPITEFTVPDFAGIGDMVVGPDKNLWFTEADQASLGRITASGAITSYPIAGAVNPPIPDVVSTPPGPLGPGIHSRYAAPFGPHDLAVGGDGNLWYSVGGDVSSGLGRMTPAGDATAWQIDASGIVRCGATSVVGAADGTIWYTVPGANTIGRLDPGSTTAAEGGVVVTGATEYTVAADGAPIDAGSVPVGEQASSWMACTDQGIMSRLRHGTDGQLWFGGDPNLVGGPSRTGGLGNIGWITSSGTVTSYAIKTPETSHTSWPPMVTDVVTGSDGTMWFTATWTNGGNIFSFGIGHLFTGRNAGAVEWMSVTTTEGQPRYLTRGPDGNIWFTDPQTNSIGRITACGVIDRYRIPTDLASPSEILSGPDGNIWFTEPGNWFTGVGAGGASRARGGTWPSDYWNAIGRLSLSVVAAPAPCGHAAWSGSHAAGGGERATAVADAVVARRNRPW